MEPENASFIVNMTGGNHTSIFAKSPFTVTQIVLILLTTGTLSLITVTGNILVMLSIKVNKNLQTVSNYFLFSLACADVFIGFCSMNIYAVYVVIDYWPLGEVACDLWLTADYVVSSASALNLLLISLDRYFCVTRPMTYPAFQSTKMAGTMIAGIWILSFILWSPLILFWPFIVGGRSVPFNHCHCQFFSNPWVTFPTSVISFYLPISLMAFLYWQIVKTTSASTKRSYRRRSGSASDIGFFVQGEGNSITTKQEKEEAAAGKEKVVLQERSETGLFSESQADQMNSALDTIKVLTFKESDILRKNSCDTDQIPNIRLLQKRRGSTDREKKVTRTIMTIMVAFIVTCTPYNMLVLVYSFCNNCIPNLLWSTSYWLCYVNSTVNPACYALCNDTFKITFKQLLLCQYKSIRGR